MKLADIKFNGLFRLSDDDCRIYRKLRHRQGDEYAMVHPAFKETDEGWVWCDDEHRTTWFSSEVDVKLVRPIIKMICTG